MQVAYVPIDMMEDYVSITVIGYGVDSSDKGPGKAMSYALKVAHQKMFMLNSLDDAGGEETEHKPPVSEADVAAAREETAKTQIRVNERDQALATQLVTAIDAADGLERVDELLAENKRFLSNLPDDTAAFIRNRAGAAKKQMMEE